MSEVKLTEAQAAAVLSGAARREAETERLISQAELLAIAREAGLSEESVMAELAGHTGAAAMPETGPVEPIQHALPLEPWEAVAAISRRAKRVAVKRSGPAPVLSAKLASGTARISIEPAAEGCNIRLDHALGAWMKTKRAVLGGSIAFWAVGVLVIAGTYSAGAEIQVTVGLAVWTGLMGLITLGWLSLLGWVRRERRIRAQAVLAGLIEELSQPGAQAESLGRLKD